MSIQLRSTRDVVSNGVKMLVYGKAGAGKTRLCATAPNPIIISAESGLLSLREYDLPYIEIKSIEDLQEAFRFCLSEQGKDFQTICLDSLTEIGEVVLTAAKKENRDIRKAYGDLIEEMTRIVKAFRDINGKNIYMSAQEQKYRNADGVDTIGPAMPGSKVGERLPYWFDEVFRLDFLEVEKNGETKSIRALHTLSDGIFEAKDRSGALAEFEKPNLTTVIKKIAGGN